MKSKELWSKGKRYLILPASKENPDAWTITDLSATPPKTYTMAVARTRPELKEACAYIIKSCRRHRHPYNLLIARLGAEPVAALMGVSVARAQRLRNFGTVPTIFEMAALLDHIPFEQWVAFSKEEAQ